MADFVEGGSGEKAAFTGLPFQCSNAQRLHPQNAAIKCLSPHRCNPPIDLAVFRIEVNLTAFNG